MPRRSQVAGARWIVLKREGNGERDVEAGGEGERDGKGGGAQSGKRRALGRG